MKGWLLGVSFILAFTLCPNSKSSEFLKLKTGADQYQLYLPKLKNKRVGVLVNQTSRTHNQHLVDFLISEGINVVLIFAPEHGFRGEHGAGEFVKNNRDEKTGIKVISLHGKTKKPLKEHIEKLDILLFDIQDVGVRFYTYISSMHYFMESCAENNIPLVILDRPNPNGDYIGGPILDLKYQSFIGMHPIPVVHGLTVAELALMIQGEDWLQTENNCELHIVTNKNYHHGMHYSLPIKPSPNLPNDLSVRLYPSLGFFEATSVSVGRGTKFPFQVLGFPNEKMGEFAFEPERIRGSWKNLNYAGQVLYGEDLTDIDMTNAQNNKLTMTHFVKWFKRLKKQNADMITRPKFLAMLSGNEMLEEWVRSGLSAEEIENKWHQPLVEFKKLRAKYLLYKDSQFMDELN